MAKFDKSVLAKYGITDVQEVLYNPTYEVLFNEETKEGLEGFDVGQETELGAINVMTGIYTGRSPKDKFIVMDENSKDTVWWTTPEYPNDNHPASLETWAAVKGMAQKQLSGKRLFVVDGFCGTHKDTRMKVRFIMEVAWQAHFVTNMFIRPQNEAEFDQEPDFIVYTASKAKVENYKELGLNSETAEQGAGNPQHLVRWRDEERPVLDDELLPATEGHRRYALLGQHRHERREHRHLLRTERYW